MPVVAQVDRKVAAALERSGLNGRDASLVVGVSGGADSSALLYSLNRLRQTLGFSLHIAHLNHDFRGEEADEDARFVAAMARELGLPFSVDKQDPIAYQREQGISSFEQGAREMRYRFLAEVAHQVGAQAVAVGHTSDDLAETVLLHIMRGSGLHGLRGMMETAPWPWPTGMDTPFLFRPLLGMSKADTVEYCTELGRSYRADSGNLLFRFTRNRVRQQLMPLIASDYNPRVRDALVRLANTASLDLDYMESELERVWDHIIGDDENAAARPPPPPAVSFLRQSFDRLHPAMQRLALRRAYVTAKGDPRRLGESHLRSMTEFACSDRSTGNLTLPGNVTLDLSSDRVSIYRTEWVPDSASDCPFPDMAEASPALSHNIAPANGIHFCGQWCVALEQLVASQIPDLRQPDDFTAYFDPEALGSDLQVRKRSVGDRFQPLGMATMKRLHNFYIDAKVPRAWRDRVPLLVGAQGIAWVVGYRIAEWAKVPEERTADTPVLRVRFNRIDE